MEDIFSLYTIPALAARVINYNGFEAFDILLSPVESNALGAGVSGVSALTEYNGLNFCLN